MSNRTRQKNKRGDSKVDSNNSPEIPDRGETSDIPSPHWRHWTQWANFSAWHSGLWWCITIPVFKWCTPHRTPKLKPGAASIAHRQKKGWPSLLSTPILRCSSSAGSRMPLVDCISLRLSLGCWPGIPMVCSGAHVYGSLRVRKKLQKSFRLKLQDSSLCCRLRTSLQEIVLSLQLTQCLNTSTLSPKILYLTKCVSRRFFTRTSSE